MNTISRFALASVVTVVVGCGASDDGSDVPSGDRLTSDEQRAGQEWAASHGADTSDDATDDLASGEASNAIAEGDALDGESAIDDRAVEPPSTGNIDAPQACNAATGYRRGTAMHICVTTVDGKPVEVATAAAYRQMQDAARRAGVSLRVVSGFRTMTEQRRLYNLYRAGQGNLAAPPGYSNHQSGHALDLNTSASGVYSWLSRHASAYGFRRTVPSEKWHWEKW